VGVLQQYITLTLYQQQTLTTGIQAATQLLGLVHDANQFTQVLDMAEFYNDAVNEPDFNFKEDYKCWTSVSNTQTLVTSSPCTRPRSHKLRLTCVLPGPFKDQTKRSLWTMSAVSTWHQHRVATATTIASSTSPHPTFPCLCHLHA
jgi:hypothetical protein